MTQPFFIISCARSGSTSLATILGSGTNCTCLIEPTPGLLRETRDVMDDKRNDCIELVQRDIVPRVHAHMKPNTVYGEKNVTYGPFIPALYAALNCKFVYLTRSREDVVRSLINWHDKLFHNIYAGGKDDNDYSRPRHPNSIYWQSLTREEKCNYYWLYINSLYMTMLNQIPSHTWMHIDYTNPSAERILNLADWLGIKGLTGYTIVKLLERRINSLHDRGVTNG